MESEYGDPASNSATSPAQTHLDALRRAEILTHTRYPKLGWWYPPTFGVLGAIYVAGYAMPIWLGLLVWGVTTMIAGAGIGGYVKRRGVMPDIRRAPAALRRQAILFFVAYAVAIAVIVYLYISVAWWAASLATLVLLTVIIGWYEARYHSTARQIELEAGLIAPAQGLQ
jgi:hypothetical protein